MAKRCGIEITGEELRYVVLEGPERRPRLTRYGSIPLDKSMPLSACVARLRVEGGLGQIPLRMTLGTQSSILRVLSLPAMPRADLEKVIAGEAEKEQRILGEQLSYDYLIRPASHGEKRRAVLLALSPCEGIEEAENAAAASGRLPESLTTSSLAVLAIATGIARSSKSREPSALLHLGSERMILTVTEGEGFRQFRDLGLGMNASLLQERVSTGTDGPASPDWDLLDQIGQGLDEVTQVAQQVRQTLNVDERQHPERRVTRLILAGDVTRAGAMAPILENELGLPVVVLDPLENLDIPNDSEQLRSQAASLVLPIALARRETGAGILHLGRRSGRPVSKRSITVAAVLLFAALAMTWANARYQERAAARRAELDAVWARAAGQALTETEVAQWIERDQWVRAVRETTADPLFWLSRTLPDGMRLVEVDIRRDQGSWRVDFTASVSQPERVALYATRAYPDRHLVNDTFDNATGVGGSVPLADRMHPSVLRADAALLAWPALRTAWVGDPAVVDIAIAPPAGIVARTRAPEEVSGTLQLRGEP